MAEYMGLVADRPGVPSAKALVFRTRIMHRPGVASLNALVVARA